jgi:ribosomal protein L37AE/L43A
MVQASSHKHVTTTMVADEPDVSRGAMCPMCHTPSPLTSRAVDDGASWRCARCGQRWDAGRLATVAAYAARVTAQQAAGHDRATPGLPAGWDGAT